MALEPRLVFDGAGAATAHAAGRDHADGADADGSDAGGAADAHDTNPSPDTPAAAGSPAASGSAPSIALIDTRVAGYAAIAASLPADTHIVYVDGSRDGLAALDAAIRDAGAPVASVSIYAHGSEASITLGKRTLDAATLSGEAAGVLAAWREALSPDADLLIYGCSVAAGSDGVGFVHALSELTGADVAASDDATGSAAAGGDWALEVTSGAIEHASGAVDGFSGLLLPTSITDSTPGTRTVAEDGTLTVTGLTLADGDDPAAMTLRVQTTGGGSTFALTGLTVTAGSNGSADVTLSGSRASLSAALAGFTFRPAADQNSGISGYAPQIVFTATDVSNTDAPASFTLNGLDVTAANDAPTLAVTPVTVAEGASSSFTAGNFNLVDVDNLPAQVIYKITALPAHGTLSLAGNPLVIGSSFDSTQAGNLVYTHDGTQVRASLYAGSEADSFTIRVDDGAQGVIAAVTVPVVLTPVNQAPGISAGATVWEGQQNVPVTLTISDPDQASGLAHTIRIDTLPLRGTLYYDGVAVTAGQSIADPTKLSYSHDGNDLNGGFPPNETFQISVTDDGGGQGAGHEQSVTQTVTLTINRVNDDPRLLTNDPLTVNGASNPIGNTLLAVSDPDSFAQNLTFTLTDTSGLAHGELQLNGVRLDAGASFTQLDIDNGALRYVWTSGTQADTFTDTFDFTVKDGAITRLPDAFTQTRDGGIYPDASDPAAALSVFTFTIQKPPLSSGSPGSSSGSGSGPNQPPVAGTIGSIGYASLSEGGTVTITHADLNFTDADNAPAEIVYRLLDLPTGGTLQLAGTALGLYDTFTQADIDAGRLQFVHAGGEVFTTDFDFNVTDGTNLNDNGGLDFNFRIQVRPVDDAPVGNAPAGFLMEDGHLVFNSDTPGPQLSASARIDLTLGDVDGSGDQVWVNGAQNPGSDAGWDPSGYSLADTSSQLYLKLDSLPVNGVLQRHDGSSWITITAADLATLKITQAELDAGRLRYQHDGNDGAGDLADSFQYTPYDRFDTAGSLQTVTLAMAPLNDPPLASINTELTVIEGGSGTIGGQSGGGTGGAQLIYSDSDNNTVQRQYRISDATDHGTLLLNGVALGIGSVFTQADLDAGHISYRNDGAESLVSHFDSFSFTVSDGGGDNPVTGAVNNVPGTFFINVSPANDLPTVHAAQTTLDVTASGSTPIAVPGVTVADVDLGVIASGETDFLRLELSVLDAADTLVGGAQIDFTAAAPASTLAFVSGLNSNRLIVQGTKAEIDAVLASLRVAYTSDRNVDTDKLRITVDDRLYSAGGTLTGGANGGTVNQDGSTIDATHNRASLDLTLTASNDNDPPSLTNPTAYTVNEDAALTLSGFSISDADSFTKDVSVTVRLYADAARTTLADAATQGALTIPSATGLTAASGNGTNTVTLTGPLTSVLAALNALRFQGATDFNNGPLYLRTTVTDWGHADVPAGNQTFVDNTITLVPVNDAPVLTVPGTQTLGSGTWLAIPGISFQDTKDSAQGASDAFYTVTVLAPNAGDGLAASASGAATSSYDAGTRTLTVSGTRTDVNATLANLVYTPQDSNADATYTLTVSVDDRAPAVTGAGNGTEGSGVDGNNTAIATIAVRVSATNDPPGLTVPATASFIEDRGFTALPGLSYTDNDDFGQIEQLTLTVTHGNLDLATRTGLTVTAGAYASSTVTVQGTKTDLNAALASLRFMPTGNYHGGAQLTVTVSDLGNTGSGGAQTDTKTVALTVAPDNDQPVATTNVTLTPLSEDTTAPAGSRIDTLAFGYSDATDDQTANGGGNTATPFTYVAIVGNASVAAQGVWQISTTASPDPTSAADWITIPTSGLSPTAALIFTSDRQVRFVPVAEFFGTPGLLSVRLADASSDLGAFISADATQTRVLASAGGLSGIGAWNAVTRSIGISVTAVNDRPTLAPATLSVAEDTTIPASQTVSALFGGGYADATDNQSGIPGSSSTAAAFAGFAIVGNAADAASQGVWQYNAGSGWVTIGSGGSAPSDTDAIVLATTAQLRFLPNVANYNGTPGSLTVRGADSVQATATGVDLSAALASGQRSTWSATTTLTATVTPVNDAPTMPQTAIPPFVSVTENATTASGQSIDPVALMSAGSVGDIDLTTTAGLGSNTFGAGSLSVTISDGIAGDEIVFASGYSLPAGVTFTGGTGNTPLVVSFDADTTLAEVDGLIAAIRYRSTSDNPTQSGTDNTRLYTVVLNDGNNAQAGGNAGGPAALNSLIRIGQIAITAVNDPPTAADDSNSISENTASVSGNVKPGTAGQDADPDNTNPQLTVTAIRTGTEAGSGTAGTVGSALAGQYGTLTLNADGTYTYALDNTNPAVNALKTGQSLSETFTYRITDPGNLSDTAQLTITIHGTTDGPPTVTPDDGNGAETGQATVFEAGLTAAGDSSETTTGSIALTAPDGLTSVTVGGTTLSLTDLSNLGTTPVTIDTGEGTLVLTGFSATTTVGGIPTAGTLAYSYTLKARLDHTGAIDSTDPIALSVLDAGGDTSTGTLTVRIVDDVPTANADANSVTEDGGTPATGNVFASGSTGDAADRIGADTTATPVTAVSFGATSGTLGSPLTGAYGALTLNADGTYSYALDNNNPTVNALKAGDSLSEVFSYTITDADGDTSSTTLTITIHGANDGPPTVTPDDGNGAETGQATVFEAGLTAAGDSSETTTGSISLTAPDGLTSVTVGGTTLTLAQLNALGTTPVTVDTGEGLLTLTGFTATSNVGGTPTAGTLAYSYTLKTRLDHTGATDSTDPIALSVLDAGGGTSTGTLTVRIVDDVPTANADTNSVTEDTALTTTGNVFGSTGASAGDVADRIGADTTANPVTAMSFGATSGTLGSALSGAYGALTLNADGTYSYALDNTNASVNALKAGDSLTEVFSYTITDADGDTSAATLTITIHGANDGTPMVTPVDGNGAETGQATVFEAGLTSTGDSSETTTGSISLTAPDGLTSVTVGGTTLTLAQLNALGTTPVTIDTGEGTLVLTGFTASTSVGGIPTAGTLTYSYTLKTRLDHTGAIDSTDPIALSVLDAGGNTSSGTLTVRIVDDVPTANADANSVSEGTTTATTSTTGNVFGSTGASASDAADHIGADTTATPVTAVSFGATAGTVGSALAGAYGALTLNADGTYSYALDNTNASVNALKAGDSLSEVFSYTITDADGDTSTATLTITIQGRNDPPTAVDDSNAISESTASVSGNAKPGTAGQDSDPDNTNAELTVTAIRTGSEADSGTDGTIGSALAGQYGSLTLNADGTYTYALDNSNPAVNALKTGQSLSEAFTYRITDPGGLHDTAQLTITIHGTTDGPPTVTPVDGNGTETGQATVFEAGLTSTIDGSETTTGTITLTAPDGLTSVTVGGTTLSLTDLSNLGTTPVTIDTGEGTLVLTGFTASTSVGGIPTAGTLAYSYTLKARLDHTGAVDSTDPIALSVLDAGGDTSTGTLTVRIVDDVPTANADANSVSEGTTTAITSTSGNVFGSTGASTSDAADRIGADTTATPVTAVSFGATPGTVGSPLSGNYGALTLNADGTYSYALDNTNASVNALKAGDSLTETFSYTITDADGDTSNTTLTITIHGANDGPPAVTPVDGTPSETGEATVFEAGLTAVGDSTETATGSITLTAPDGLTSVTVGGTTLSLTDLTSLGTTPVTVDTGEGTLVLTGFTASTSVGGIPTAGTLAYSYTLKTRLDHTGAIDSTDPIALSVLDAGGDTSSGTLTVRIVDDVPTANADANSVSEGTTTATTSTTGNVFGSTGAASSDATDRIGADTTATPVTAVSFGATSGTVGSALSGAYGALTLNADGTYSYALDNTNASVNALKAGDSLTETFSYTITDADGDTSSTTLTITIHGANDGPPAVTPVDGTPSETGEATVFEAGLTAVGDSTETATGSITLTAPDGLTSVTVGGTTLSLTDLSNLGTTPVTIDTGEGLLTLTGFTASTSVGGIPTAGTLAYSYTLKARLDHTGAVDSTDPIALSVLDAGGDTSTGTLTVRIVDDVPTANADTNSVTEDGGTPATGNVFASGSTGDATDRIGADIPASPVTAVSFGATSGTIGSALSGNYGALTLNADGTYSYALDNTNASVNALKAGDSLTETFSYTITDADGDTSSTTLTITIQGANDGTPTVTPVDGNGAETGQATVFEAGLTSTGDSSETTTGSISLTAPDGLTSVTVGGTTLSLTDLSNLGTTPVTIDTGEGTLVLTGFTASTSVGGIPTAGTLTYSYTLKARLDHTGATDSTDPIALSVLDAGGDTSTGTLTVRIVDDVPTANADANSVTEDAGTPATGNVFGSTGAASGDVADRIGADTIVTPVTAVSFGVTPGTLGSPLSGAYGALTLNADGTYSYVLDNSNPTVNALKAGDSLSEVFTYTITDADGDTSNTTLTITIHGANDGPPAVTPVDGNGAETGQATVFEAGLTSTGDGSETTTGSISITAPDGLTSVTVGGTTLSLTDLSNLGTTPVTIDTGEGLLTLTGFTASTSVGGIPTAGALAYSYTLKARLDHTGAVDSTDPIALSVLDAGGDTSTGTLTVRIVDDVPTANADTNSVTEDAGTPATGNVFASGSTGDAADRIGADTTATPVTAVSFGATSGTLGSPLSGAYGALTLNADGTYSYALDNTNASVNALKAGDSLSEVFSYTIADADGDTSSTTLTITIHGSNDGTPTVTPVDGNGAETGQATVFEAGLTAAGDSSETTTGSISITAPDGLTSVTVGGTTLSLTDLSNLGTTPVTVDTGEGTLVLTGFTASTSVGGIPTAGTLAYSYTLKARLDHTGAVDSTDPIALSVLDAGGDTSTGTLTVRIVDDVPTANADANSVTEDAGTPVTGNVFGSTGAASSDATDRIGADTPVTPVTAMSFGVTAGTLGSPLSGTYGALTLNADGTYSYALNNSNPTVNALKAGDSLSETFTYTITDADGDISTATLTITVQGRNDPPVAVDDSATTPEDTPISGNLLSNDSDIDTPHADLRVQSFTIAGDPAVHAPGATATIPGVGTLTISATGDWLFTPATDYSGPVPVVTYTLTDGTLTDTATLTLDVTPVTDPPTLDLPPASVDEDGSVPLVILPAIGDTLPADLGIEHLSTITISGIPEGSRLSNAAGDPLLPAGGVLTLTPAQLAGLSFAPPRDYSGPIVLNVTAVAQDGSAPPASITGPLSVTVRPVTDTPVIDVVSASQTPDGVLHLDLASHVTDTVLTDAGTEHVDRVTISGLPEGTTVTLADGTQIPVIGGVATLTPDQLTGIRVQPPGGFADDLVLQITSWAVDGSAPEASATTQVILGHGGGKVPPINPPLPPVIPPGPDPRPSGLPAEPPEPIDTPFPFLFNYGRLSGFERDYEGHDQELYLYGQARDQLMVELRTDSFTQPKDLFRHTNPAEHLSFEAVQPDGRPLPAWLKFDAGSLRFSGTPPAGFGGVDVVIIAYDSQGRSATALFRIRPAREVEPAPAVPVAPQLPPPPEPAPASAPPSDGAPPQAARSLPAADWLAALGLHDDAAAHPAPALAPDAGHDGFSVRLQQALPPTLAEQSRALADVLLAAD